MNTKNLMTIEMANAWPGTVLTVIYPDDGNLGGTFYKQEDHGWLRHNGKYDTVYPVEILVDAFHSQTWSLS